MKIQTLLLVALISASTLITCGSDIQGQNAQGQNSVQKNSVQKNTAKKNTAQQDTSDSTADSDAADLQQQKDAWNRLSDVEKQRCMAAFKQIQKLEPKARQRLLNRLKNMSSEQKTQLDDILQKFQQEKPEIRQQARRKFRERELWLKTQSPEFRERLSKSDRLNRKRHYEERLMQLKKRLISRVPDHLLDEKGKRELLGMKHEEFRRNISRLVRQEISSKVSDRTMSLINDFESLTPPQIMAFLRHGKCPPERTDLQQQFQQLDDQEKVDVIRFLKKIAATFRANMKPPHPRPHDRGNRPGRGVDQNPNQKPRQGEIRPPRSPRGGTPPRRPDSRPNPRRDSRPPARPPELPQTQGFEASMEIHSHQG